MQISVKLKSQLQIAIMHVLSRSRSILCDAPHCVSGTLNFITFGKIPFGYHAEKREEEREEVYHSRMLLESEPKAGEKEKCYQIGWKFNFQRKTFQVAVVFSTLEKFISKWVLSVFSHEFTSSQQHEPPSARTKEEKKYNVKEKKWI